MFRLFRCYGRYSNGSRPTTNFMTVMDEPSTESDMVTALIAATGTMKGPLHSGAPSKVINMIEEIGSADDIEPWLRQKFETGQRLIGLNTASTRARTRGPKHYVKWSEDWLVRINGANLLFLWKKSHPTAGGI